ncbi:MAG: hypothetical protein HN427_03005 [Flavobacteriales bacterium]|nr:hypothetical protein [Flavobacteriales bacterium]MBT6014163.1 hypothetical protein [Flavobacteriales bacterium]
MRIIAQILLLLITIIVFIFALLSGSEGYGGGFMGIVKNSPNALPWLLLFGLNYLVWKKELLGGIILTIFGLFITWLFNFSGPNFWWTTFAFTSFITLLGVLFIYFHLNDRRKKI